MFIEAETLFGICILESNLVSRDGKISSLPCWETEHFHFFIDNQQHSIEYLSIIYVAYFTAQTSTKSEERNSINYLLKWSVSHTSDNLFKLKHKVGRYVNIATIVLFMKNPFVSGSRA